MINGIKTFARENKSEIFYFTVLLIALLVIAIPKWQLQHSINISNWDSYIYLDNGRSFAGMGWGDLPQIAPFVSFLLSIYEQSFQKTFQPPQQTGLPHKEHNRTQKNDRQECIQYAVRNAAL